MAAIKRLALDTNVPLDCAAGKDFAHEFREAALANGYQLFMPPTAIQELAYLAEFGDSNEQALSCDALDHLLEWSIGPYTALPVGNEITHSFSDHIRRLGILPDDEKNDGIILAEVGLAEIPVLISNDSHLVEANRELLTSAFTDRDITPVVVMRPAAFSKAFR